MAMRNKKHRPSSSGRPRRRSEARKGSAPVLLYGIHAVEAALANPKREIRKLHLTENATRRLESLLLQRRLKIEPALPKTLDRLVSGDAVHQGAVIEVEDLPPVSLDDIMAEGLLVVLDQVTDPQNVGAVLRSAAVFGATGLVLHDRHSPPLTGALAKAASGALDTVPIILVPNLARALTELGERGFARLGLAEQGSEALETATLTLPMALVLGAENKGLRQLTRECCDQLCRITTRGKLASLNVSNAAAIALHWVSTTACPR